MTGIPDYQETIERLREFGGSYRPLAPSSFRRTSYYQRPDYPTSWWQKAVAFVSSIEEIQTKVIGKLLTDDPKYDQPIGDYYQQVGFRDLLKDAGFDPVLASVLGVAVAIANPTDPFNKLSLFSETASGVAKTQAAAAHLAGTTRLASIAGKQIRLLDAPAIEKALEESKKFLEALKKNPPTSKDPTILRGYKENVKAAQRSVKSAERTLPTIEATNKILTDLQVNRNMSWEDLIKIPGTLEQIRAGDRSLVGLTRAFGLEHIPFYRTSDLQEAIKYSIPGVGHGKIAAAVAGVGKEAAEAISTSSRVAWNSFLSLLRLKPGYRPDIFDKQLKHLFEELQGLLAEPAADAAQFLDAARAIYLRYVNLPKEELLKIRALEDRNPLLSGAIRTLVKEIEDTPADKLQRMMVQKVVETVKEKGLGVLTEDKILTINPARTNRAEAETAVDQFATALVSPIPLRGGHSYALTEDYVIVKLGGNMGRTGEGKLKGIFEAQGPARIPIMMTPLVVVRGADKYLVARKIAGGQPIASGGRVLQNTLRTIHLENLGRGAAQLASRRTGLAALDSEAVIISPYGGVQVIQPEAFIKNQFRSNSVSRKLSDVAIRELANISGINPSSLNLSMLRTTAAAQAVKDRNYAFVHSLTDEGIGIEGGDVAHIDIRRLMDAENMGPARQLLRGEIPEEDIPMLLDVNEIQGHLQDIQRAKASGIRPVLEPITYMTDPTGRVWIVSGRNRITAAAIEGVSAVPVHRKPFMGELAIEEGAWYTGFGLRGVEALDSSLVRAASRVGGPGAPRIDDAVSTVVDPVYRLLGPTGGRLGLLAGSLEGGPVGRRLSVEVAQRAGLFESNQVGKSADLVRLQQANFIRTLEAAYGDLNNASMALAVHAEQATDILDFEGRVIADLQARGSRKVKFTASLENPALTSVKTDELNQLKEAATELLDHMARNRVLVQGGLTLERSRILSQAINGTFIGQLDEATVLVTNVTKTADETQELAKQFFNKTSDVSNIRHLDNLVISGSDTTVQRTFADLTTRPHPRLDKSIPMPFKLAMTPEQIKRLQDEHKIFHVPVGEKIPQLDKDVLRVLQHDVGAVWFRMQSGDLFIRMGDATVGADVSVDSVALMLQDIFDEAAGSIRIHEYGFLMRDKLVVSNPLGGMIETLDPAAVKLMENRIRDTAQQFLDMGLNPGVRMDVVAQFDPSVWERLYYAEKRFPTVGFVASKKFKLVIPEDLRGRLVDIDMTAPFGAVRIDRLQMSEDAHEVYKFLETGLDEAIRSEILDGLPLGFFADYMPRFMPKGTRDALNGVWDDMKVKHHGLKRVLLQNPHLKDRRFTDLRINEINDLFKKTNIDLSDIVKSAASKNQMDIIRKLADMVGGKLDFFYTDPVITSVVRRMESFRIAGERKVIDFITNPANNAGVVFSGTAKELRDIHRTTAALNRVETQIERTSARITQITEELKRLDAQGPAGRPEAIRLQGEQEKLVKRMEEQLTPRQNKLTALSVKQSMIARQIPEVPETVWIRGSAARQLLASGTLSEASVVTDSTADMVQIFYSDTIRKLNQAKEVDLILMTPELEAVMIRLFDIQKRPGRLLKFYDDLLSLWKQGTLFPIPAFHIRNMFSDAMLMTLAGVGDFNAMNTAFRHMRLLNRFQNGQIDFQEAFNIMESERIYTDIGSSVSMSELWNKFIGEGGIVGQFVYNEFNRVARFEGPINQFSKIAKKHNMEGASALLQRGWAQKVAEHPLTLIPSGKWWQTTRETWLRYGIFLETFRKTGDMKAAGRKMREVLYDYGALTSVERFSIRRLIPFYAWLRFNIPRMVQTLATEPVFHARIQAGLRNIESDFTSNAPIDENALPLWLKALGWIVGKTKDGSYWVKSAEGLIPLYDLVALTSDFSVTGVAEYIQENVSPILKLPLEQMLNKSFFTQRELSEVVGEPAKSATLAALGATRKATLTAGPLPFINLLWNEKNVTDLFRFGKQVTQVIDFLTNSSNFRGETDIDAAAFWVEMTLGRMYKIDPKATAFYAMRNEEAMHRTLERLARRAWKQRNMPAYHVFTRRLTQLRIARPPKE